MIGSFFPFSAYGMDENTEKKLSSQKSSKEMGTLQESHEKNKNIILNKIKPSEYGDNEVEKQKAANILIEHGKVRMKDKDFDKSFLCFLQAYQLGSVEGGYQLALLMDRHKGKIEFENDPEFAEQLYENLAKKGHVLASSFFGLSSYKHKDYEKAKKHLEYVREAWDRSKDKPQKTKFLVDQAKSKLARIYLEGLDGQEDFERAKAYFQDTLDSKDTGIVSSSSYYLGVIFYYGLGGELDFKKALEHFHYSSKLKNPVAMHQLATMHFHGEGVEPDVQKAIGLYMEALTLNCSESASQLGYIYEFGFDGKRDRVKALQYYKKALSLKMNQTQMNESDIEKTLTQWEEKLIRENIERLEQKKKPVKKKTMPKKPTRGAVVKLIKAKQEKRKEQEKKSIEESKKIVEKNETPKKEKDVKPETIQFINETHFQPKEEKYKAPEIKTKLKTRGVGNLHEAQKKKKEFPIEQDDEDSSEEDSLLNCFHKLKNNKREGVVTDLLNSLCNTGDFVSLKIEKDDIKLILEDLFPNVKGESGKGSHTNFRGDEEVGLITIPKRKSSSYVGATYLRKFAIDLVNWRCFPKNMEEILIKKHYLPPKKK